MYNYKEEQFKQIIEHGIYWLSNLEITEEYVNELRSRGYDFYSLSALGRYGVENVIFNKESCEKIYEILALSLRDAENRVQELKNAMIKLAIISIE